MNRFIKLLGQRAVAGGLCLVLASVGLVVLAQEASPPSAKPASAEQLQTWLAELDSDSFEVREAAAEKLAHAGPAAVEVLAGGVVSESAEIAWRSGAALERIAVTGDEKTLGRITSVLDNLSTKGKPGLRTMAAEMHVRQKHFRHDRAVASLKQNGAIFSGDGMEFGGGPVFFGGPIAVAAGPPIMIEEIEEAIEVVPELEPAPAKVDDGILGVLSRLFGGAKGADAIPRAEGIGGLELPPIPDEPAPKIEVPVAEPAKVEPIADPPAIDDKPAAPQPGEPAQVLEEFKELSEPIKAAEPAADERALAPPPALPDPVIADAAIAVPLGVDFIGGGIIGFDEGEVQVATSLMLGKQWRGSDDGLKVLKDVPEIWSIMANSAKISDAALSYMAELPNLNSLVVQNTPVTRDGLRKLREQKPALQIQARGEAMMGVNADIGTSPLVLTSIFPDSGALHAGLREGDIIKAVDGAAIKDFSDLTISIYGRKAGKKVQVEYERNGAKKSVEVLLKKRADDQ